MTLEQLEVMDSEVLTCKQVGEILGMDQTTLHLQAVEDPQRLGFPVVVAGSRVKIPRRAFINFMKGERA